MRAPIPDNEADRLRALRSYEILDTEAEIPYDDVVKLAAMVCDVPVAAISFLDAERQWTKACVGIDVRSVSRDVAFCAHTILEPFGVLAVEDTRLDPRFADNPYVAGENGIRFYIGISLSTPEGLPIGALCAIDYVPREATPRQIESLKALAKIVLTELELKRTRAELRRQNEALRRAKESLEAGALTKAAFLSNMSHEIRTPMNGILGIAGLLGATYLNESQRHYVATIQNSAESLLSLLTDILDLAEIGSGQAEARRDPIDLPEVIDDVVALVEPMARLKRVGLTVHSSLKPAARPIADGVKLRRVLLQLLDEAVRCTDEGTIELAVSMESGMARFDVRDGRKTSRHRDAGLGFALSAELLRLMNGSLESRSRPGGGLERSFLLPAAQPPAVLVVDDNSVNSMVLAAILERHGCRVHCAAGGREAVEAASNSRYDLVFMDLMMPEMDGFEATREIRRLGSETAKAPIVAVTSSPYEGALDECLGAGMNDYLNKPIREPMIVEALTKWDRHDATSDEAVV